MGMKWLPLRPGFLVQMLKCAPPKAVRVAMGALPRDAIAGPIATQAGVLRLVVVSAEWPSVSPEEAPEADIVMVQEVEVAGAITHPMPFLLFGGSFSAWLPGALAMRGEFATLNEAVFVAELERLQWWQVVDRATMAVLQGMWRRGE